MKSDMIKSTLMICVAGMFAMSSFAQEENLVPNGSFEATGKSPKKLGSIESATGWISPTGVRADLFTPGKYPDINTPENIYGKEDAKDGDNYAGIIAFSYGDKMQRSYIMNKLSTPMKKGMKYCVQFNVSLAEASKYASNQLGVNFDKKGFSTAEKTSIIDNVHVVHEKNKVLDARYNWERICGVYEAQGGEKFITIGNFSSNDDTKSERIKKSTDVKVTQIIAAYYYIDDVSVVLMSEKTECDCAAQEETNPYSKTIYQKTVQITDKMTAKEKVEIQSVYFGFGKSDISQLGEEALNVIANEMKANANMKIQVKGYSDAMEDEVGAEKSVYSGMDSKRANAIVLYLIDQGIEEHRLIPSPQGSGTQSKDVLDSDDDEIRQAKNRRVEFIVR